MSTFAECTPLELEQAVRRGDEVVLLDVRGAAESARWHVPLPAGTLVVAEAEDLERSTREMVSALGLEGATVHVICRRGNASRRVSEALASGTGVRPINVRGGMAAWSRLLTVDLVEHGGPATIVQLRRESRGCLSYLVAGGDSAIAVDPSADPAPYVEVADALGVRIDAVLDTHVHADHVSGAAALSSLTGAARLAPMAALLRGVPTEDVELLLPGRLRVGDADVRVLELPGHTTDNVGLLVDGCALIAGDSLFEQGVARPDLERGADGAAEGARGLHTTIHERILSLGSRVRLLPAHYAGGRRTRPVAPRLGSVQRSQWLLSLDADAFVAQVLRAMPERPANHESIIAANLAARCSDGPAGAVTFAAALEQGGNSCAAG